MRVSHVTLAAHSKHAGRSVLEVFAVSPLRADSSKERAFWPYYSTPFINQIVIKIRVDIGALVTYLWQGNMHPNSSREDDANILNAIGESRSAP
jgi:hypothetical protein